jgi:hypothetical protein
MHFLFNLLRIKGLYMFRALTCSSSGGTEQTGLGILRACSVCWLLLGLECNSNPGSSQLTKHAHNIPSAVYATSPEDGHVMPETCRGPYFLTNWIQIASRWFHYTAASVYTKSSALCLSAYETVGTLCSMILRLSHMQCWCKQTHCWYARICEHVRTTLYPKD